MLPALFLTGYRVFKEKKRSHCAESENFSMRFLLRDSMEVDQSSAAVSIKSEPKSDAEASGKAEGEKKISVCVFVAVSHGADCWCAEKSIASAAKAGTESRFEKADTRKSFVLFDVFDWAQAKEREKKKRKRAEQKAEHTKLIEEGKCTVCF